MTNRGDQTGRIAAIDTGSNAIRMGIAVRGANGRIELIERFREPVRLGHDVFTIGTLGPATMEAALGAFRQFRLILDQQRIDNCRAVATSAMREAKNGRAFAERIQEETGIRLEIISGEEEARLIQGSIAYRVDLVGRFALLIDIGGGSVEITLCDNGRVIVAESFPIGTVRLLEMFARAGADEFNALLSNHVDTVQQMVRQQIGNHRIDLCLGTGGNALAIGELGQQLFGTASAGEIGRNELVGLIDRLTGMDVESRISELGLRPDRADVILPAAIVFREMMALTDTPTLTIPDASLLDGIAITLLSPAP